MPISTCPATKFCVTRLSLLSVFTPSGIMGWSDTNNKAPVGMWLANPQLKRVAVSMSTAMARVFMRYSLNLSSCSQIRRLVV